MKKAVFETEAALCKAFISSLPEGWTAYAETADFDILLVRGDDGVQVGIEAKLTLNAKVLVQAVESLYCRHSQFTGPDFRAVLVPEGTAGADLRRVATLLGVTVIRCQPVPDVEAEVKAELEENKKLYHWLKWDDPSVEAKHIEGMKRQFLINFKPYQPDLPKYLGYYGNCDLPTWQDLCPAQRCKLPDYVPDVGAGTSAPIKLSDWKIKAIKISILLDRRGEVTISDFKIIGIDRQRWLNLGWLSLTDRKGVYHRGPMDMHLKTLHPTNYTQIEEQFDRWAPAVESARQENMI